MKEAGKRMEKEQEEGVRERRRVKGVRAVMEAGGKRRGGKIEVQHEEDRERRGRRWKVWQKNDTLL